MPINDNHGIFYALNSFLLLVLGFEMEKRASWQSPEEISRRFHRSKERRRAD
jgi:hypothetical protein